MTTLPKPQPTDGNPEAPQGPSIPTGRQASSRDLEAASVVAGEPPGGVPVRGELDATITGGEDSPDAKPRHATRSRRAVREGPLGQPVKPGSPPRTELSERLIIENEGLAKKAAFTWSQRCSKPFEDFIGPALEGLINGCRRYDPTRINPETNRPYAVSTCVCPFITGAIKHHIRDHGYEAKLPSRWRECYPKVRRLLTEGQTLAQIVAAIPAFTEGEIVEMLGAMQQGSVSLDVGDGHPQLPLYSDYQPEATDDPVAPALYALVEAAFDSLRPADRGLLERWAENPFKKVAYPSGPMAQFHNRLKSQLRGKTLKQFRQVTLGFDVLTAAPTPRERRPRQPRPAPAPVVQPSLFGGRSQRKPHPRAVKL